MTFMQRLGARFTLVAVNVLCLLFSCFLIFYGTTGFIKMGRDKTVGHVTNAFALVISMGTIMLVVALFGLLGACCSSKQRFNEDGTMEIPGKWKRMSNRILYAYFSVIMLTIACLLYGTLLCFVWSTKASDYVDAYLDILEEVLNGSKIDPESLKEMMYKNSKAAGGLCIGMIFINLICVHCCAVLMGYKYTARKTVMWINGFGFLIGLSVMIVAFMPATQEVGVKNSWLPEVIGFIGILLVFFAITGFYAASRLKAGILLFNSACLSVLSIILLGFAIFCLADGKDAAELVKQQLPSITQRFVNVCPNCCLKASKTANEENCPSGSRIANTTLPRCCPEEELSNVKFKNCCELQAGMLVWNNLSVLGVTCTVAFLAIVLNLAGSFVLHKRIKKDLQADLEDGELDGLENGTPREGAASRAQKYRTEEPDDGL
eukprot:CAMPEP_0179421134 /NCGR_PEP_ID=MMETSP0799-20121207/9585_1 /TAXON_ID=46947 /ORGANISM="Geminigera cryophila, Strain CCMP2564" /LENGTH=432 /DNA_ID=CAMNT_0021194883 /DNA_START=39 /DNA_END=1337 /DNA_ORIENTATION=+